MPMRWCDQTHRSILQFTSSQRMAETTPATPWRSRFSNFPCPDKRQLAHHAADANSPPDQCEQQSSPLLASAETVPQYAIATPPVSPRGTCALLQATCVLKSIMRGEFFKRNCFSQGQKALGDTAASGLAEEGLGSAQNTPSSEGDKEDMARSSTRKVVVAALETVSFWTRVQRNIEKRGISSLSETDIKQLFMKDWCTTDTETVRSIAISPPPAKAEQCELARMVTNASETSSEPDMEQDEDQRECHMEDVRLASGTLPRSRSDTQISGQPVRSLLSVCAGISDRLRQLHQPPSCSPSYTRGRSIASNSSVVSDSDESCLSRSCSEDVSPHPWAAHTIRTSGSGRSLHSFIPKLQMHKLEGHALSTTPTTQTLLLHDRSMGAATSYHEHRPRGRSPGLKRELPREYEPLEPVRRLSEPVLPLSWYKSKRNSRRSSSGPPQRSLARITDQLRFLGWCRET